ncbi:hypothetical protein AAVH_14604, partial [Aphelenchoides avenae]
MSSQEAATEQPAQATKKRGRPPKSTSKSDGAGPSKAKRGRPSGSHNKNKVTGKPTTTKEVVRSKPLETQAGRVSMPTAVFNIARPEYKDNRGRKKGSK